MVCAGKPKISPPSPKQFHGPFLKTQPMSKGSTGTGVSKNCVREGFMYPPLRDGGL